MELLTSAMSWLAENGLLIVNALLSIVGSASVLAKLTPTTKDIPVKVVPDKVALNSLIKK